MHCTFKRMSQRLDDLEGRYTHVVAFQPTGWSFGGHGKSRRGGHGTSCGDTGFVRKRTSQAGRLTIYSCPYSEHSSFEELRACVNWLRPKEIVPTVNCSTKAKVAAQIALLVQ